MRLILAIAILSAAVLVNESASACQLDGREYPPGTRVGSLVCQPDGTWKP